MDTDQSGADAAGMSDMLGELAGSLADYHVVLEPERNEPGWWAGAPTVARSEDGAWYLVGRMRETESARGQRGYELRLMRSDDGIEFREVGRIHRDDVEVPVFERPSLVRDPHTGQFILYACAGFEDGWSILRFDPFDDLADVDPSSAEPVLSPTAGEAPDDRPGGSDGSSRSGRSYIPERPLENVVGFKDPFVFRAAGEWHMFVIGQDYVERPWHFASSSGTEWRLARSEPILPSTGWHDFYTRPASVIPLDIGYLVAYEGSNLSWHSPVYNIVTGLAYTPDLDTFTDLTPEEPLLTSTTPGDLHTWRYSHWMIVDGRTYVYFEAARPNGTHELRVATFDLPA